MFYFRGALIQTTPEKTAMFVYATLAMSVLTYGRFVVLVISDITEYLGIACLTVRKKDNSGHWVSAAEVDRQKNQ
jgi:ethanolaminephosphotransferase